MKIGKVVIDPPVMNAACSIAKTIDDVKALSHTKIGAILVGSITLEPRKGNSGVTWLSDDSYSINSFGMPNQGAEFYQKHLPEMIHIAHKADKIFVLSVAGFTVEEYVQLAMLASEAKVDLLEINLGCPNISTQGKQKPIFAFDLQTIQQIIEKVSSITAIPLLVKLSPYSNPTQLKEVAAVIASSKASAIVTSNTFPNGAMSALDTTTNTKLAGIGGKALFPIALGQVQQFRKLLPKRIKIIGVGGIETKEDAQRYFDAGADAVQAATLIVRDGHQALNKLCS